MENRTTRIQHWDDLVFTNRHTEYGAYAIRQYYESYLIVGFGIALISVALLILMISILAGNARDQSRLTREETFTNGEIVSCNLIFPAPPRLRKKSPGVMKTVVPIVRPTEIGTRAPKNETELVSSLAKIANVKEMRKRDFMLSGSSPDSAIICYLPIEPKPSFPGGTQGIRDFIAKRLRYPTSAREIGIEGNVFISFTVDIDGTVKNVKCVRGIYPACDEEAVRVVSLMNGWLPAKYNHKSVAVKMTIPIKFVLERE